MPIFMSISTRVQEILRKNCGGGGDKSPRRIRVNPRTAGGLSHLRTAGGGIYVPPRLTRKLRNASTSRKKHSIGLNKL